MSDEINQAEPVLKRSRRYSEAHVATTEHTEGFHRVEKVLQCVISALKYLLWFILIHLGCHDNYS